jgi:hypothetical protein
MEKPISSNITHGDARRGNCVRIYQTWRDMKNRCSNPNSQGFHRYGGRGISVCVKWQQSYLAFKKWALENGYKDNLVIDRINNDRGYNPYNCQWITGSENSIKANKGKMSKKRKLTIKNASDIRASILTPPKLALMYNVSRAAIHQIIKNKTYVNEASHDM